MPMNDHEMEAEALDRAERVAVLNARLDEPLPEINLDALDDGWEWAVVEIMGHRKHAGRTREVERFGAKLIRIDVPIKGDPEANGWRTIFYSGSSLFSFTPAEREAVMAANKPYEPPAPLRISHELIRDRTDQEEIDDADDMPF